MQKSTKKKEESVKQPAAGGNAQLYIIIAAIAIIAVVVGYLVSSASLNRTGPNTETFSQFLSSFYSAPRVAIYVTDYVIDANDTTGQYTFPCMSSVIGQVVASRQYHRNASTIDLYILNSTGCKAVENLGSQGGATSSNLSLESCTSKIGQEPTIFINYSSTNTTIIKQNYLYTAGTSTFLSECGIASEIG